MSGDNKNSQKKEKPTIKSLSLSMAQQVRTEHVKENGASFAEREKDPKWQNPESIPKR